LNYSRRGLFFKSQRPKRGRGGGELTGVLEERGREMEKWGWNKCFWLIKAAKNDSPTQLINFNPPLHFSLLIPTPGRNFLLF